MSQWKKWLVLLTALGASALGFWLIGFSDLPLGILGEWVWNRSTRPAPFGQYLLPGLASVFHLSVVAVGYRLLRDKSIGRGAALLPVLVFTGAFLQATWLFLPSAGIGPERVPVTLFSTASSGYFWHARLHPTSTFLQGYNNWIRTQDSFHIGTHPPGLFLLNRFFLDFFEANPQAAQCWIRLAPERILAGFQAVEKLTAEQAAAILAVAAFTWMGILLTSVPIFLLANRCGAPAAIAWLAAGCWPLIPSPMVFFPVADCFFPLISVACIWMVTIATTTKNTASRMGTAMAAGVILWMGMVMSLAFLALLPILFGVVLWTVPQHNGGKSLSIRSAGKRGVTIGFFFFFGLAACSLGTYIGCELNLPEIWSINLSKHAGFYEEMPRSYWKWIAVNPVEFVLSCGPSVFVVGVLGLSAAKQERSNLRVLCLAWLATLLILDLSGKNLSEVARLWIFLSPFVCLAFAEATRRLELRVWEWYFVLVLQALGGMTLMGYVEPLLPFTVP